MAPVLLFFADIDMLVQALLLATLTLSAGGVCFALSEWPDHFEPQLPSACYAAMQSVI